ncbi:MAG: hypothetical protein ACJA2A_002055 [Cycloclasticus pugetii]|jgi:hypothetical protein
MLSDDLSKETRKAEEAIRVALQKLHETTGLIPVSVSFSPVDVRCMDDHGKRKQVVISDVEVIANT